MSARRRTLIALIAVPIVTLLALASVGLASAHPSRSAAKPGTVAALRHPKIVISSFTFTVPGHVSPGAKVVIINKDGFLHSVTSDDGTSFSTDAPGSSRVSFRAPATAGSYPFHCRIHTTMHGTLVVR